MFPIQNIFYTAEMFWCINMWITLYLIFTTLYCLVVYIVNIKILLTHITSVTWTCESFHSKVNGDWFCYFKYFYIVDLLLEWRILMFFPLMLWAHFRRWAQGIWHADVTAAWGMWWQPLATAQWSNQVPHTVMLPSTADRMVQRGFRHEGQWPWEKRAEATHWHIINQI